LNNAPEVVGEIHYDGSKVKKTGKHKEVTYGTLRLIRKGVGPSLGGLFKLGFETHLIPVFQFNDGVSAMNKVHAKDSNPESPLPNEILNSQLSNLSEAVLFGNDGAVIGKVAFSLVGGDNQFLGHVTSTQPGVTSPHSALPHVLFSLLPYRGSHLNLASRHYLWMKFEVLSVSFVRNVDSNIVLQAAIDSGAIPKAEIPFARPLFGGQLKAPVVDSAIFPVNADFWSPPTWTHSLIEQKIATAGEMGASLKAILERFLWGRDLRQIYSHPFVLSVMLV
jgi:hypothetical protein